MTQFETKKADFRVDAIATFAEQPAMRTLGISLSRLEPGEARRNLVTRGVPLNHLVGREFRIGDVLLRGLRLCEPCEHLEALTVQGIKNALCHRGGLRAQIIQGGIMRTGDSIGPHEQPA